MGAALVATRRQEELHEQPQQQHLVGARKKPRAQSLSGVKTLPEDRDTSNVSFDDIFVLMCLHATAIVGNFASSNHCVFQSRRKSFSDMGKSSGSAQVRTESAHRTLLFTLCILPVYLLLFTSFTPLFVASSNVIVDFFVVDVNVALVGPGQGQKPALESRAEAFGGRPEHGP